MMRLCASPHVSDERSGKKSQWNTPPLKSALGNNPMHQRFHDNDGWSGGSPRSERDCPPPPPPSYFLRCREGKQTYQGGLLWGVSPSEISLPPPTTPLHPLPSRQPHPPSRPNDERSLYIVPFIIPEDMRVQGIQIIIKSICPTWWKGWGAFLQHCANKQEGDIWADEDESCCRVWIHNLGDWVRRKEWSRRKEPG